MGDWTEHMGGWWWVMVPLMVAFWVAVIWSAIALLRRDRATVSSSQGTEGVLAERLARGDIDEVEYRRRRALIRS